MATESPPFDCNQYAGNMKINCNTINFMCFDYLVPNNKQLFCFYSLFAASILLTISGIVFLLHSKLKEHQFRLTGLTLLAEAAFFWTNVQARLYCKGFWPNIHFYKQDMEVNTEHILLIISMGNQAGVYFYLMYVINVILFADLYLTIKNPFKSTDSRIFKEIIAVFLLTGLASYFSFAKAFRKTSNEHVIIELGFTLLLGSLSTIFVFLSVCRLKLTGTNKKLRRLLV